MVLANQYSSVLFGINLQHSEISSGIENIHQKSKNSFGYHNILFKVITQGPKDTRRTHRFQFQNIDIDGTGSENLVFLKMLFTNLFEFPKIQN